MVQKYQILSIICLITIIKLFIRMKNSATLVKLEQDVYLSKSNSRSQGPFFIQHGPGDKKPVFIPSSSNWTGIQNAKYSAFIMHNKTKIEGRPLVKLWEIFKQMSAYVGTKNFRQCKAHHQKLSEISETVSGILDHLQTTILDFDNLLSVEVKNYKKTEQKVTSPPPVNVQEQRKNVYSTKLCYSKQSLAKTAEDYNPEHFQKFNPYMKETMMNYANSFAPIYMQMQQTQNPMMPNIAEQWMQCHRLFSEWITKMKELQELNSKLF